MMSSELKFIQLIGPDIESIFNPLAALRIEVFRDFPYLYEGSVDYEKEYLKTYSQSDRAMAFGVMDGERMIGATTCIPLEDETDEVRQPFEKQGIDVTKVFYFGESLLLKPYRGKGLGHRFFDEREQYAQSFGTYTTASFCAVERPADHQLRPYDYRTNDAFWLKKGYVKRTEMTTTFSWLDIGEHEETAKVMTFWIKNFRTL